MIRLDAPRWYPDGAATVLGFHASAAGASGRVRAPHPWASAFSTLCWTLNSRKASLEALRRFGNPPETGAEGPPE